MSEPYDWDFRALLGLDDEERHAAMGAHVLGMLDAGDQHKEEQTRGLLDLIARAKQAEDGDQER